MHDHDGDDMSDSGFNIRQVLSPTFPLVAVMFSVEPTIRVWSEPIHYMALVETMDGDTAITMLEPMFKHSQPSGGCSFEPWPNGDCLGIVEPFEFISHESDWLLKAQDAVAQSMTAVAKSDAMN